MITGSGIEDMSLNHAGNTTGDKSGTYFIFAYNCWMRNIRSLNSNRNHVWLYQSAGNIVRDSYFYGTQNAASQSYGIELFVSSGNLIENNIFQHITAPMNFNGAGSGSVFGYNYSIDDYYNVSPNWMQASAYLHAAGVDMGLFEGNDGAGFTGDVVHGTHHFITAFRNVWSGFEPGKSAQTVPVHLYAFSRFMNVVGNVLGQPGYHTQYEDAAPTGSNMNASIFVLGWSSHGTTDAEVPNDPQVRTTLMRWGNYDVATGTSRFVASEVPSTIGQFPNAVPSTQTLPGSLYLSAKPSWWPARPWPAIGPDITGGELIAGHAYKIPARLCYENTAKTNGILNFNANNCYGSATSPPPPAAPANVRIIR